MFMFCRLAMMKEFLFMSGLEEPLYTHPARAPHTHTHSLPTAFAKRDLPDERGSPLLPWWTIGSGGHGLWYVTLILCDIFSSMLILVHVKGFYCSPAAWLWSLLLSFFLFEPYVWPDFPFPHFFFFVVTGIMMWFIHVGVPMPGASSISPDSLIKKPAPAYVVFRMLVCPPSFLTIAWPAKLPRSTNFTTNTMLVNHPKVSWMNSMAMNS